MTMWAGFVDLIYTVLFSVSTALGGSMGWSIAVVSLVIRLALLPLTLRMAYHHLDLQARLRRLEPEVQRTRRKYRKDERKVLEETGRLYQQHGVRAVEPRSLLGGIVQAPVFLGLFGAIRRGLVAGGRFLWVKDIAAPDALLAVMCAGLTAWSAALAPTVSGSPRLPVVLVPAVLTLVFLWRMAAGLSIYTLAQGLVGLIQAALVHRRARITGTLISGTLHGT
jgi:YidC/Oxa1 family membrane protein insertase